MERKLIVFGPTTDHKETNLFCNSIIPDEEFTLHFPEAMRSDLMLWKASHESTRLFNDVPIQELIEIAYLGGRGPRISFIVRAEDARSGAIVNPILLFL